MPNVLVVDIEKFFKGTETDAEKFAVAFEKLFKKAPTVLQSVENFTGEVAPVIEAAVALAAPEGEPEVTAALTTVETGLAAIQAAAANAQSGTSLVQNLQNFATSVPSLLTSVDVKNPTLKSTVTRIVNLVAGEAKVLIPAVQAWVKQIADASSPAPTPAPEPAGATS